MIKSLGYLVVETTDLPKWRSFARDVLGAAETGPVGDDELLVKIDERPYRLMTLAGDVDRAVCFGWQVVDESALAAVEEKLKNAGIDVTRAEADLCRQRRVRALISFVDPGGARTEVFAGPILDHVPFASPFGAGDFVTGDLGLGHVVIVTPELDATSAFYQDVLGFEVSDHMVLGGSRVVFLHCNGRHHSLALADGAESHLAHFMFEVANIDDVGYALDRFVDHGYRIKQGLGRHSNDRMLSFYAATPGPFDIEYGCGGLVIDPENWTTAEITRTSFWGHRRPPRPASAS